MDTKTKIHTIISIVLISLITALVYWMQLPADNLKAQIIDHTDTVLVRIQDYAFDPYVVRVEPNTTVSWLNDETEANADVQHIVASYDPDDASLDGEVFESDYLSLGETFSYTFNEEGVYNYNDSLYPFMLGKVCVGAESEALDSDCAIDLTETVTEREVDPLFDEETLDVDDEDLLLDAEIEDEEDLEDIEDIEDPEDFVDLVEFDEEEMYVPTENDVLVIDTLHPSAEEYKVEVDKELTDSGPEYLIYAFVAIFALYSARKFTGSGI